ncbi:unnamed protein product [Arabidopsis halleri]
MEVDPNVEVVALPALKLLTLFLGMKFSFGRLLTTQVPDDLLAFNVVISSKQPRLTL